MEIKEAISFLDDLMIQNKFSFSSRTECLYQNKEKIETMQNIFDLKTSDDFKYLYGVSEFEDAVLRHVAEWIYFIDAIDDLDKDAREGSYNPFLQIASSHEDLIVNHFDYVTDFITNQHKKLVPYIGHLDMSTQRGMVIINVLNYLMPTVTRKILLGEKAFMRNNPYVKYIEGKGGIVFA